MRKRLLIGLLSAGLVAAMLPGVVAADGPDGTPGGEAACPGQVHAAAAQGSGLGEWMREWGPPQNGVYANEHIANYYCRFPY